MRRTKSPLQKSLPYITKGVIYLMIIAVIVICAIWLPELAREEAVGKVSPPPAYPWLIGAWILSIPVFVALNQTLKLVDLIGKNNAFSMHSVTALQNIKYCTLVFSVLIAIASLLVIVLARMADPTEDITHIITMGTFFIVVPSIVATFIAVLQRLLEDAINIKEENNQII